MDIRRLNGNLRSYKFLYGSIKALVFSSSVTLAANFLLDMRTFDRQNWRFHASTTDSSHSAAVQAFLDVSNNMDLFMLTYSYSYPPLITHPFIHSLISPLQD
jgi:hypothetical protein